MTSFSSRSLRIGIDASNLLGGGGRTHLIELLANLDPTHHRIGEVTVWGSAETLSLIERREWLKCRVESGLSSSLPERYLWQKNQSSQLAEKHCDILFVPGATYIGNYRPFVTMSRNLLPFDDIERRRFGLSWTRLRYHLLEISQRKTFQRAAGIIFLTESAKDAVIARVKLSNSLTTVVNHGVNSLFDSEPQKALAIDQYSPERPFRWLYVSTVNFYKHQWKVADAVSRLRDEGMPIRLDLVGPGYRPALTRLKQTLNHLDRNGRFIQYHGAVPHQTLNEFYDQADGFIFASSCETFGQILVEAMHSGLPIACSDRSAMPEILKNAGIYFNPERPESIANALRALLNSRELRDDYALKAYTRSKDFTWERCADETFSFIGEVARRHLRKQNRS